MKGDPKVLDEIRRKDLSPEIMRKAIAGARRIANNKEACFMNDHPIDSFCIWSMTKEGLEFWANIHYHIPYKKA